ncbi:N-acetyltransferase 10 [Coemansia aciculifera]|nr:N-acetyltransferase 10 [Coemansia aciculifera]
MSDAPAHQVFVLLPPIDPAATSLPEPLCAIQVCLEGEISRQAVMNALGRGERSEGDLIPWLHEDVAELSGARVVRIATHPDYASMGYGTRALDQLRGFYQGQFYSMQEDGGIRSTLADNDEHGLQRITDRELEAADLQRDAVGVRDPATLPALFLKLAEKRPTRLHWLGVSYGLTPALHKFWKRAGYVPVYLRQTSNELTGEYSCVMLSELAGSGDLAVHSKEHWLDAFARDFHHRFATLLSYSFKDFSVMLAMAILDAAKSSSSLATVSPTAEYSRAELMRDFSGYDLKRLESYANHLLDYHVVLDMLPTIAARYFDARLGPSLSLSGVQACILLGLGLQRKSVDQVEKELNLPSRQILALFTKILRKFSNRFRELETKAIEGEFDAERQAAMDIDTGTVAAKRSLVDEEAWDPTAKSMEQDLEDAGREVTDEFRIKQREMIDAMDLSEYAIAGGDSKDWEAAETQIKKAAGSSSSKAVMSVVSVKNQGSSKKSKLEKKDVAKDLLKSEDARVQKSKKSKTSKKTGRF